MVEGHYIWVGGEREEKYMCVYVCGWGAGMKHLKGARPQHVVRGGGGAIDGLVV